MKLGKRMKRTNRKQRNNAGFSLAETLMAVLILLMVSAVVAAGMPMAREAYEKAVDAANAQTLLSTTMTLLRSELGEAQNISVSADGGSITYRSARTGARAVLFNSDDNGIMVTDYAGTSNATNHLLVTSQAATERLRTSFTASYSGSVFTVTQLQVTRSGKVIAQLDPEKPFKIRTVNPAVDPS